MESIPEQEPTVDVYEAPDGEFGVVVRTVTAKDLDRHSTCPRQGGRARRLQPLAQRRELMNAWSDYLDGLRTGGNVVAINSAAA